MISAMSACAARRDETRPLGFRRQRVVEKAKSKSEVRGTGHLNVRYTSVGCERGREATLRSYSNDYSNIQINRALGFDLIQVI